MTTTNSREASTRVDTAFGTFQVAPHDVIAFPSGMPGFEQCRRFVLLSSDELAPFQCLQSVDGPAASFLVIDPRRALPDYRCALSETDRLRLGGTEDDALLWAAIVTVQADQTLVNLRAPVVINPTLMVGYQLMPSNGIYPLRFELTRVG